MNTEELCKMNEEEIGIIKELCKEIEPKYKKYISTHPISNRGIIKERRTFLIQEMENAKDFIRAYGKTIGEVKRCMYAHSALYCLEEVERMIN